MRGAVLGSVVLTGDATVIDVVATKTFYSSDANTKNTGTMVDRGTVSTDITTVAQQVTIAAGKHSGTGVVKISATEQAKIIAGNVKSGVTILGVGGSVVPNTPVISLTTSSYTYQNSTWYNASVISTTSGGTAVQSITAAVGENVWIRGTLLSSSWMSSYAVRTTCNY